jgi:hypothetical protein
MTDLTDLQEDVLILGKENPDATNTEIAKRLDCSSEYVGKVQRRYEDDVSRYQLSGELNTVSGGKEMVNGVPQMDGQLHLALASVSVILWMGFLIPFVSAPVEQTILFIGIGWLGVPAVIAYDLKARKRVGRAFFYIPISLIVPMFFGPFYLWRTE